MKKAEHIGPSWFEVKQSGSDGRVGYVRGNAITGIEDLGSNGTILCLIGCKMQINETIAGVVTALANEDKTEGAEEAGGSTPRSVMDAGSL